MKILIVARTRRGSGACVGGITEAGKSVRLIAHDAATNPHAGLDYAVGDVWDAETAPDPAIIPPHVENVIILRARKVRPSEKAIETIHRFMPPAVGGAEVLFDGLTEATAAGGLFVAHRLGLPCRSTMFWKPSQTLRLDCDGKRIRYRYPGTDGGRTLTFVGFQEPLAEIPAGTLLRVSLAHWWRPRDRPNEELRCFVQLSGWFTTSGSDSTAATQTVARSASPDQPRPVATDRPVVVSGGVEFARARTVLKTVFGHADFLPVQAEVVARVLQRQDTLAVMPTGGGKSLCYQLPAVMFDGLTVVVSPLVALMEDQVRQLEKLRIPAACLNHTVLLAHYTSITNRVRNGRIRLLYLSPETLLRPETLLLMQQSRLTCLAVDEAHCISEWGHDFRPEYRHLRDVRPRFPEAVCLALTATATRRVREDIRRLLDIPAAGEFVASFDRPNLFLAVEPRRDGLAQVLAFLEPRRGQSGIIYCGTRKHTDELAAALTANGWPALPYHAGLEDAVRRRNQEHFVHNDPPLMVATIAFGMGINKPDIRFVIHAHLPGDLESYYQEIGRAGRDGQPAHCLLLHSRADAIVHRHFIEGGAEMERLGRQERLNTMLRFAETRACRRAVLLAYFGEKPAAACGHCDICVLAATPVETKDVTATAQKFLACVLRTGECFGPEHIIAVLRGSRAARVLDRRHDRLKEHGSGRDTSAEGWRALARQFIHAGLVEQDVEFGGLRLTVDGRSVLRGKQAVRVPDDHAPVPRPSPGSPTVPRPGAGRRSHEIGERFAAGCTLEELAGGYQVQRETILHHLQYFLEAGGRLDPARLLGSSRLPAAERARVFATFQQFGHARLAPVHAALGGAVGYDELRLLQLVQLCRNCGHHSAP
jgi:ATP-dependent DNA helicase RecQ